jgi:hypothetical protein
LLLISSCKDKSKSRPILLFDRKFINLTGIINDGWKITHDPYGLPYRPSWSIDLGAEKTFIAEKGLEKIAVEVKSFQAESFANEFHGILGQYLNYRSALQRLEPDRTLYLAVPQEIYDWEFQIEGIANSIADYNVHLVIYDPLNQIILAWVH